MGCLFVCGSLLKFEAESTGFSEILVNIYQTILLHHILEEGNLLIIGKVMAKLPCKRSWRPIGL
jgi:hypothetical protein